MRFLKTKMNFNQNTTKLQRFKIASNLAVKKAKRSETNSLCPISIGFLRCVGDKSAAGEIFFCYLWAFLTKQRKLRLTLWNTST